MAIQLINRDNENDDVASNPGGPVTSPTELSGAWGVEIVTVGGNSFAYVGGLTDQGISAFSLASDGALTPIQNIQDAAAGNNSLLNGAANFAQAMVGGTTYLYVNARNDDAITVYSVGNDGLLTFVQQVQDAGSVLNLNNSLGNLTVAEAGGNQYLIASGFADDGLSVFEIGVGGMLVNTGNVTDGSDARFELDGAYDVATATVDGNTFVFAASLLDDGVTSFSLNGSGVLTFADSVQDNTTAGAQNLGGAVGVATATIEGTTYLIASGIFDSGLDVFSVNATGQLGYVSSLTNGTSGVALGGAFGLTTFTLGGKTHVAVNASSSNALTLLELDGTGQLSPVAGFTNDGTVNLASTRYSAFSEVGGTPLLVAASHTEHGISSFEITGASANTAPTVDTNAGSTVAEGGTDIITVAELDTNDAEQADLAITYTLDTTVLNGTLFLDADGSGTLNGAETALAAGGTFTQDDISNNRLTYIHNGSETTSDTFQFDVSDGTASVNDQTFNFTVTPSGPAIVVGSNSDETLRAGDDGDYVYAGGGMDTVYGGEGADVLLGEEGDDTLSGGGSNDYLLGGTGTNVMSGGDGNDVFISTGFNDSMYGEAGNDSFYTAGATGQAVSVGGEGNDQVVGGDVNDFFYGGEGDDYLYGNGGNDVFLGGGGTDVFFGGIGNDYFEGGTGTDYGFGGAGADTYRMNAGDGSDIISDFEAGIDNVIFANIAGLGSFADVQSHAAYFANVNATIITGDDGTALWLEGLQYADLQAGDFSFL